MVTYSKNTRLLRNKVIIRSFRLDPILRQFHLVYLPKTFLLNYIFLIMGPAPGPSDVKLI